MEFYDVQNSRCRQICLYNGWIIQPSMSSAFSVRTVARLAMFVALIIGSDWLLSPLYNVKLVDMMVFISAFLYGFRFGAAVGVLSELVWGTFNPLGFGGPIIPFLVTGELLYAFAGSLASKIWGYGPLSGPVSPYMGAMLAVSTFFWDVWTNLGTAVIAYYPKLTVGEIISTELFGAWFMFVHEFSNLFLGMISPLIIAALLKAQHQNTSLSSNKEVKIS